MRSDFPRISFAPCACGASPASRRDDGLIDVHHHHIPPFYLEEYRDLIAGPRGGKINSAWLSWSPQKAIDAMDVANVSTAVLSLTTPGVWFGDPVAARRTTRQVNEYAAGLARTYPGRFGLFIRFIFTHADGNMPNLRAMFGKRPRGG